MSLLPSALMLFIAALLPSAMAQTSTPQIEDTQNSKVAITGAIIGGILVVLVLVGVAVYLIERACHRRRKPTSFARLPTHSEAEPYQYLSLPPLSATKPLKGSPHYPGTASPSESPNVQVSFYGGGSPLRSPGAPSFRADSYSHGPFYPGASSPPENPHIQASFHTGGGASPLRSPAAHSFRIDPYGHGPFYPESPDLRASFHSGGGASPLRSPAAQSFRVDPYGHGPSYPGSIPSPPSSSSVQALSVQGASPTRSPGARSVTFRTDSTTILSLYSAPSPQNLTTSSS
ncbi:hypothetical protein B0H10DRAFT_2229770 [Mycena sp. CBHHK59/15]|nr:hypothetical protein B0H10DRAFT_2229770 [Mycena sp. CBHHK59/15]